MARTDSATVAASHNPPEPIPVSQFCRCGHCVDMEKREACVCCHDYEPPRGNQPVSSGGSGSEDPSQPGNYCLAQHPDFVTQILSETSLKLHFYLKRQFMSQNQSIVDIDGMDDKARHKLYRFVAYFSTITWLVKVRLGKGKRMAVPSCMTNRIHDKFPDPDGDYVGYVNVVM